ncbi:MAG TPA: hypothetical protein VFE62_05675 [Gemmataceae bacterium]|nr:hypothetical protein [Gemmataceae bacterium]
MTTPHRLYVGTIGEGLWRSLDGGATFKRTCDGMFVECHVRALAVHPREPRVLYLGNEHGLYCSHDGADNWRPVDVPVSPLQIWSVLLHPAAPERILVGACPARLFRSQDAGRTWTEPFARMMQGCPRILHTRVTTLCAHRDDSDTLWAGIEIDGLQRTRDGGQTWHALGTGLSSQDIHALAFVPGANGRPARLIATTNNDVNISEDDGETWRQLRLGQALPLPYFRGIMQRPGQPEMLLLGNGDGPPGTTGLIARSLDGGTTWQETQMPSRANSTIWNFAVHAADVNLVYASSVSGQVYRSEDGGASWVKLPREFGEIRALAWTP